MAGSNWGDSEIRELLSNRADGEIHRYISGTVKDGPALEKLTKQLNGKGFNRTKTQVTSKLKALRKKYHQVNDHNGRSGRGRLDWAYFDQCQTIWGSSHSANPVALVSSMEAPTEDADTSGCFPEASLVPESRCSSPRSGEGSGSEDSSARSSVTAPEDRQACAPAPKRRRQLTRAQEVTEEMKAFFLDMDRKDEEKDRLRDERQRAEEEQHRREAREAEREAREDSRRERAEHASYFGDLIRDIQKDMRDQASLLRDLVSRMPGPTGQHAPPHHYSVPPPQNYNNSSWQHSARQACAPAPKRRRQLTRAQEVTEEMKAFFLDMDRKDEEKDRLRDERQRAEEEQHRREAREAEREAREDSRRERAEHASYFGDLIRDIQKDMRDQASLLRDLVSRMPGPTGQHAPPHHYSVPPPQNYNNSSWQHSADFTPGSSSSFHQLE